jgi:hypothetical protein
MAMSAKHVITNVCFLLLGLLGGWMMRSSQLNDDYQPYAPKHRPKAVPQNANWVGGADGGAYVRCFPNEGQDVDECSVWNDNTGGLVESGKYKLAKEQRAATEDELKVYFPDFGGSIYLENGLVLKRQSATP